LQDLPTAWERHVPAPSTLQPNIPAELDALVLSLLHMDPLRRPASAAEVIDRLGSIAGLAPDTGADAWQSYLRAPTLVGRHRVLRHLRTHLERAFRGEARSVLIAGSAGIGRTRLLEETALEAQLGGAVAVQVGAGLHQTAYGVARAVGRGLLEALPGTARRAAAPHVHVLGHVLPELADLAEGPLPPVSEDPAEQRARTQTALTEWILAIAAERPVALCIDDVQAADDNSLAMLAVLPWAARDQQLLIAASQRSNADVRAPDALEALKSACHHMQLHGLEQRHTEELVGALFGDAQHGTRLARWLQDRTDGRPLHIIELAHHLVRTKVIRYVEGSWAIPQVMPEESLPTSLEEALATRLEELGPEALELARVMSLEGGPFSLERVAAATGARDGEAVRSVVQRLVDREVWAHADGEYHFRQEPLRQRLLTHLSPPNRRQIHLRIGEWRMRHLNRDSEPMELVDAGRHLLQGGQEGRGADLLAWASTKLWKRVEGLDSAASAAELALEVYDRQNRPARNKVPLLTVLALAGWYVDWRYSDKYGPRAVELGAELTGMKLARRLGPRLGSKLALVVGVGTALVAHLFKRQQIMSARRSFQEMMSNFFSAAATRMGVAATYLDVDTVERTLEYLEPLSGFGPRHPGGLMYRFYRQLLLTVQGDETGAITLGEELVALLSDREHWLKHLDEDLYRGLFAGVLLGLGTLQTMRDDGAGLKYARELEKLDLAFYKGSVAQLRLLYHACRGELGEVAKLREQVDALAVQGGAVWQSEINVAVAMNKVYQQTGDLMGTKQTVRQLESWAAALPNLRSYLLCSHASYALAQGDADTAIARYEEAFQTMRPGSHVGWADSRGYYARAFLAKDQPERAKEVCLEAIAHIKPENLPFVQHYLEVQRVLALARARLGELDTARRSLDDLLVRHASCGPVTLSNLHHARAELACLEGDRSAFLTHVTAMESLLRPTGNAAMLRKMEQLVAEGEHTFGTIPGLGAGSREGDAASTQTWDTDVEELRSLLERCRTLDERAETVLRALQRHTPTGGVFLYGRHHGRLHLLGQTASEDPPQELMQDVQHAIDRFLEREDEETASGHALGDQEHSPHEERTGTESYDIVVLHTFHDNRPAVVGAAALELGGPGASEVVPLDVIDVVARSFFEAGDLSLVQRLAS
ncbi:MAG: ATP-binding protein, partial [Myxococcota bacterium]